jgi:glyoxylase-like metal-dependent hydrolase (beta-lactamase superfamily II)
MAGFRISPSSPPVQHTRTLRTPSAWYFATVEAPLEDSSSGCACTQSRQSSSVILTRYGLGASLGELGPGRLYDRPMPEGLFFRQLLAGRDFAAGDQFATTMRNHVYVVGDAASGEVLLVDPAYDVRALVGWVEEAGLTLAGVLATHYHADHVGGDIFGEHIQGLVDLLELAEVPVHVQKDEVAWVVEMSGAPVSSLVAHRDDDVVQVGAVEVRLLHTPGHTPGSQCFVVGDNLVSGDTLFLDGCGRTDLPGADPDAMYTSLQRLASLPGRFRLWPGHHYSPETSLPLEEVRRANSVLARVSREQWLRVFS